MAKKKKFRYDVRSYFEDPDCEGTLTNFGVETNSYECALKVYSDLLREDDGFTVWKENAI